MDPEAIERELLTNWVRRTEAAGLAGVSAEWVRTLAASGRVRSIKTPAGLLFNRGDLERIGRERAGEKEVTAAAS